MPRRFFSSSSTSRPSTPPSISNPVPVLPNGLPPGPALPSPGLPHSPSNVSLTNSLTSTQTNTTHTIHSTAPSTFFDSLPLPRLLVFDLDFTLWPLWVDTHVTPPLKPKDNNTRVVDKWGESFSFYPGVPNVLHAAREKGIAMSVASRTHTPDLARDMLKNLVITPPFKAGTEDLAEGKDKKKKAKAGKPLKALDYFSNMQIFPGSKVTHFERIQEATRKSGGADAEIPFADMLFFDDEARNRNVEVELGVTFWLVRDGVTREEVDKGIWEWRKRRGIQADQGSGHDYGNRQGGFAYGSPSGGIAQEQFMNTRNGF